MDQNGPQWTKMDHFGPFWSRECQNPVRNKVILTKMVVRTILDHFGPVHFPTVPRPFPRVEIIQLDQVQQVSAVCSEFLVSRKVPQARWSFRQDLEATRRMCAPSDEAWEGVSRTPAFLFPDQVCAESDCCVSQ